MIVATMTVPGSTTPLDWGASLTVALFSRAESVLILASILPCSSFAAW